jgi:hypothetical protein
MSGNLQQGNDAHKASRIRRNKEAMNMAFKKIRNMKVYEQSGYRYKSTPTIMLKGQWLRDLGFEEGTPITVECAGGKLVITRADEVIAAEPVCMVAEAATAYGR